MINIVYSFIGNMQEYILDSIHQTRLVFDGPIYIIYNNINNILKEKLNRYNINFIPYEEVKSERMDRKLKQIPSPFEVVGRLGQRSELFYRSYERIFLLENIMKLYNIQNIWHMEIDIMLYENPNNLLNILNKYPLVYGFQRPGQGNCSTMYIRDLESTQDFFEHMEKSNSRSEMTALGEYITKHPNQILFPMMFPHPLVHKEYTKDFSVFNEKYIFDGAAIGIWEYGKDPIHTGGIIRVKNEGDMGGRFVEFYKYGKIIWKKNEKGLRFPYFECEKGLLKVVNMHIHSKQLKNAASDI